MKDYYAILGVPTDAASQEIRSRYRALKGLYDDQMATYGLFSEDSREENRREIEDAFRVLSDPETRQRHDDALRAAGYEGPWHEPTGTTAPASAPAPDTESTPPPEPTSTADAPATTRDERPVQSEPAASESEPTPAAPPEVPEPPAEGRINGAWLQTVREVRGVGLEELSRAIKITVTQLENIEQHRFERLPAPVYLKGFLRSYAQYVGIDAERLVEDYIELRREWEQLQT